MWKLAKTNLYLYCLRKRSNLTRVNHFPGGVVGLPAAFIARPHVLVIVFLVLGGVSTPIAAGPAEEPFDLTTIGTLPIPTVMHGSAVVGSRLYIFGGNTEPGGWTQDVWSAQINSVDGLEEWRNEAPLPLMSAYFSNSTVVSGEYIYIFGGSRYAKREAGDNEGRAATNYLWTKAGKDGVLEPWRTSEARSGLRVSCAAACTTGTLLFVVGGSTGDSFSGAVEMADISPDGAPENWRTAAQLPTGLWFHGAGVSGDSLFVWGGLPGSDNKVVNPKVWRCAIGADGTLGDWTEETASASPRYSGGSTAAPGYLVTVAGRVAGGLPVKNINYAMVVGGGITEWKVQETAIRGRVFGSLAPDVINNRFFITGGMDKRVPGSIAESKFPSVDDVIMCTYESVTAETPAP